MRFLVDECTGPRVASWLRANAHEVFSVYDEARGMTDDDVLAKAYSERWILITNDKHSRLTLVDSLSNKLASRSSSKMKTNPTAADWPRGEQLA